MIKLKLTERPKELTEEVQRQLTEKFKQDGTIVWKKKYIENALLEMSHYKCAYSELRVNTESNYMEIDHFKCKDLYADCVVEWGNLLPSCKKCNSTKRNLDVMKYPIVNPLTDNPKDFLYVKSFRYYARNDKGKTTIKALAINDLEHFMMSRFRRGNEIRNQISDLLNVLKSETEEPEKYSIISKIKSKLESCGPEYEYSAVISTYILYEDNTFKELENYLKANNLWDSEFETIKNTLTEIAMPEKTER